MGLVVSPWIQILVIAAVFCFLPWLLHFTIVDQDSAGKFLECFKSSIYFDSLLIAMAVSIPMWFDFFFDLIHYKDSFRQDHCSRSLLLSGIVIPNGITLLFINPATDVNLILGFFRMKEIIYIIYFSAYLYNFGGPVWTVNDTFEFTFLLLIAELSLSCVPFFGGINILLCKALAYTLYAYAALRVFRLSHYWFRHLGNRMLKLKQDEYRCTVFILAGIFAFLCSKLIDVICGIPTYLNYNETCLIIHTFFMLVITVVINIFNTRIARREMVLYNQLLQLQNIRNQVDSFGQPQETVINID
mmetsp:Transcript_22675/g.22876  ORF Transcript_22675/g.22876 Transcript_22675/m.22876 type:complete len:301 (+) Transcript_22675:148-1050(+)